MIRNILILQVCLVGLVLQAAETNLPLSAYQIYAGSTHAHTEFTWSHGAQWIKAKGEKNSAKEPILEVLADGTQKASKNMKLRLDWQKVQGPPALHYAVAKKDGFDFYVTSDHSQEVGFNPVSASNTNWVATKEQARAATDANFVALAGYEHSENNGPGGKGHINVINSAEYLNALAPGVDLKFLYKWLATAKPNGDGPVVATFNHPGANQYGNWADRTDSATDVITMLEVINGNNHIHYAGFIAALDHGWKVSPVAGHDNHGIEGIKGLASRTFVLATNKTKVAILDAMKNRRTYAALDRNIQCRYAVNGAVMGSTIAPADAYRFEIELSDPDTTKPKNKITKLDIVKDGGKVVESFSPEPAYAVRWTPMVRDSEAKYFFVRVWSAGGGDAGNGKGNEPVAWLAPVWTGK